MSHPKNHLKAFTLIELLIVVAIIAILAAIAVPNFLEAQTRSKVSRVKADMRSIATAIETYRIDNNGYPSSTRNVSGNFTLNASAATTTGAYNRRTFRVYTPGTGPNQSMSITTPVAYMTSVPTDVFADTHTCVFGYYAAQNTTTTQSGKKSYIVWSFGPDKDEKTLGQMQSNASPMLVETIVTAALDAGNFQPLFTGISATKSQAITYDPTNGTISQGDVWRFSGQ